MIMDINLIIDKINKETRSSIEQNLKTFIVQVNTNNEVIKMLNNVLKELPEYKNLQKKYDLLLKINKDLEEKIKLKKETKNITLTVEPFINDKISNNIKKIENEKKSEEETEKKEEHEKTTKDYQTVKDDDNNDIECLEDEETEEESDVEKEKSIKEEGKEEKKEEIKKYRWQFDDLGVIERNYSRHFQDMFVI